MYVLVFLVSLHHIRLIDLVSAKGKTKVTWLILFNSFIRQCFNILIRHSNRSRIRNTKIGWSKQLHHNNTLPLFSPLPKLGQWMWRQLTERVLARSITRPQRSQLFSNRLGLRDQWSHRLLGCYSEVAPIRAYMSILVPVIALVTISN